MVVYQHHQLGYQCQCFLASASDSRGLCVWMWMVCEKTQEFILVQAENLYVQFVAARVSHVSLQ